MKIGKSLGRKIMGTYRFAGNIPDSGGGATNIGLRQLDNGIIDQLDLDNWTTHLRRVFAPRGRRI